MTIPPTGLTVLYDEDCALCRRAALWLTGEPAHVPVTLLAAGSAAARARFGPIRELGDELVVVADDGRVWWGSPDAYLMCLWALERWRPWAMRLAKPVLAPLAGAFFKRVATHRAVIGAILGPPRCEDCVPGAT
jgi:predicted DCC family thiol-disulfide oxidoreductase YuxK